MSLAWETTIEDVWGVLRHYGGSHDYETILDILDHDKIEDAALNGLNSYDDDLDEQTNYAFAEIERQLKKKHILPLDATYWQDVSALSALSQGFNMSRKS